MLEFVRWAELELRVQRIAGVGVALRPRRQPEDRTTLPVLGRQIWELRHLSPVEFEGIDEVIASDIELLVQTRSEDTDALLRRIGEALTVRTPSPGRHFQLPVCFEMAADWEFVEAYTGLERDHVIARLIDETYTLGMYGFLPGFAYLLGLDADLRCPRKTTPVTQVAPGSVALGGDYLGVYALGSPAGWQVIGRTPVSMFSLDQIPPMTMSVGDRLIIARIDAERFEQLVGHTLAALDLRNDTERPS